jgi:hypothetical protein
MSMDSNKELEMRLHQLGEHGDSPEGCAAVAVLYENASQWVLSAKMWHRAAGASAGHNRRQRYTDARDRCEFRAQHPLSKQHLIMLLKRVPEEASQIQVNEHRILFNMPHNWVPSPDSGIFDLPHFTGCRWQVRL